jgi:hypothetical protein
MAKRPIFLPTTAAPFKQAVDVEFQWHPGMAASQKKKSVQSLHTAALAVKVAGNLLEISTKSEQSIGYQLSAFNLKVLSHSGKSIVLENLYQASKVFDTAGPFADLMYCSPIDAKKDLRLKDSGDLRHFVFKGDIWSINPPGMFYDWLYLNFLQAHPELHNEILSFDGFTDIEFNPKKSYACQAASVAMFVGLSQAGLLKTVIDDSEKFIALYQNSTERDQIDLI